MLEGRSFSHPIHVCQTDLIDDCIPPAVAISCPFQCLAPFVPTYVSSLLQPPTSQLISCSSSRLPPPPPPSPFLRVTPTHNPHFFFFCILNIWQMNGPILPSSPSPKEDEAFHPMPNRPSQSGSAERGSTRGCCRRSGRQSTSWGWGR